MYLGERSHSPSHKMLGKILVFLIIELLLPKKVIQSHHAADQLNPMLLALPGPGGWIFIHKEIHLAEPGLVRFLCSCCWHFKLSQREVTTISNFVHKKSKVHENWGLCCYPALKSSSPPCFPPLKGLLNLTLIHNY